MRNLVFGNSPGGTNILIAAHELLCQGVTSGPIGDSAALTLRRRLGLGQARPSFDVFSAGYALKMWKNAGIAVRAWECLPAAGSTTDKSLAEHLIQAGTQSILTDTGYLPPSTHQLLWRAGERAGIPAHAFLDRPLDVARRFQFADGSPVFPTCLYVSSDGDRGLAIGAGVPRNQIEVIGDIHLERVFAMKSHALGARASLRREWGAQDGDTVILFASECVSEMAHICTDERYDELAALRSAIDLARMGLSAYGLKAKPESLMLVIRPHPADSPGKYGRFIGTGRGRISESRAGTSIEAILAADVVLGMNSQVLYEAVSLGQPAFSLVENSAFAATHQWLAVEQQNRRSNG